MKSYSQFLNEAVEPAQKAWQDWLNSPAGVSAGRAKSSEEMSKAAKEFMRTFQKTGKAPAWATSGQSTQKPPTPTPEPAAQPKPKPKPAAPRPAAPTPNRAASFARGAGRFGAATAVDVGTELAISKIKDPGQQAVARTAKDLALTYAAPVASLVNMQGSTPQRQMYQADKTTRVSLPANYGNPNYEADPNNPRNAIIVQRTKPRKTDDQLYDPNNPLDVRKWKFQAGSPEPVGKPERYGVATQAGQRVIVPYGSVAGQKKVGTPADVRAKEARERMRAAQAKVPQAQRVYGGRQGSAVRGLGGPLKVDTKANTITTQGRTAKLPSTQILPGGRVGDLAYRNGKPVYLARTSMAQRGNQSLLARLSRATGIGGQRQRDAAALARERQTAMANTQRYRQQLGVTGTGVSINPNKK